jgi:hypothetical protein
MSAREVALCEPVVGALPEVTADAALADRSWFADRPERRFRARPGDGGVWIIRRRPQGAGADALLRTFSRTQRLPDDSDRELAGLWYAAANPAWPSERVQKAARGLGKLA